jgi:hypothetical protein|tara:strand:- start:206 stop:406 length:201 start_codon:yes stop_codon:yes gene_type:complete
MILGLLMVLKIAFMIENKEFFDTAIDQMNEGATWHKVGPQPPDPTAKAITLTPPDGKPYIIWKLKK